MIAKLSAPLRDAPVSAPAFGAMVVFVAWATDQAGQPVTHWAPGGLALMTLLVIALLALRGALTRIPRSIAIAVACLAAYTALSYLSILWAGVEGDAWEGANRTLVYLIVFALFACWPQRGASAALLLGGWTLAIVGMGAFTLVHLAGAGRADLAALAPGGRLIYPAGYANADAAQWLMAFWPALLMARRRELAPAVRGLLAGGAVLLGGVALLSQSRGSFYTTPVMLALVFLLLPGRVRTFSALVPVAAGIAAAAPAVLRVGDHLRGGEPTTTNIHSAVLAIFIASAAVAVLFALAAGLERRLRLDAAAEQRVHRLLAAFALALLVVVVAGGVLAAGHPVRRVEHAWETFKSPSGYNANGSGNRLVSGLGSNRYDFYRVALDEFAAHPLAGTGADNFQQQYLVHGRSLETPHYPHSVELRTLTETGVIGAALALAGLGAALLAAFSACRDRAASARDPLAPAVAAAALGGFAYWLVHGSVDWFWEFAGLGAPAFALLGLACSLAPAWGLAPRRGVGEPASGGSAGGGRAQRDRGHPTAGRRGPRLAAVVAAVAVLVAAALSLAAPWFSQLEVQSAARVWTRAPAVAYSRLHEAADLNPLSDEPYLVSGSIALRFGELARADEQFAKALGRAPGDVYATLQRGAIASAQGRRAAALRLILRAHRLAPRDQLTQETLSEIRRGRRVDIVELQRAILRKAGEFL